MEQRLINELYRVASENAYPYESVADLISAGLNFHDIGYCIENDLPSEAVIAMYNYGQSLIKLSPIKINLESE